MEHTQSDNKPMTLQQEIEQMLRNNDKIDKRTAKELCSKHGAQYSIGLVKESIEISLMHIAREFAVSLPFHEAYETIRELYMRQPKVGEMTSEQMSLQQYSTSLPVAYLMSAYVSEHNNRNSLYLEPSAGNGFLTIALPAEQTICNEIAPLRLENLMNESYRKVICQDGLIPLPFDRIFDGIVSNPPFLKTAKTNKLIFNALDCMKDNGRAAILRDKWNSFKPYFGTMQRSELNPFFDELFAEYNVVKIINLKSTEVYSRQGTVTPMQIILINGRRAHKEPNSIYRVMNPDIDIVEPQGFDGLMYHFSQAMNVSTATNEPKIQITEMKLMRKGLSGIKDDRIALFHNLLSDPHYKDVSFNPKSNGLKAMHKGHRLDKNKGRYETDVVEAGYAAGHAIILEDETDYEPNTPHTEGTWDGKHFEIAGKESVTCNSIKRGLKHCAQKIKTQIAVLNYPCGGFDIDVLKKAISRYKGLKQNGQKGEYVEFERIICVQNKIIVYDEPFI